MIKSSPHNSKSASLTKGAASVVCLNARSSPRVEVILSRSNTAALARDWKMVGNDIRTAMSAQSTRSRK